LIWGVDGAALKVAWHRAQRILPPRGIPRRPGVTEIEHDTAMLRFLLERFNVDSWRNSVELSNKPGVPSAHFNDLAD